MIEFNFGGLSISGVAEFSGVYVLFLVVVGLWIYK